jgi:hypothetical protein
MVYHFDLPPRILARGFWLYAWKIVGPQGEQYCYIGMTGDVTGVAQSPFARASSHLGFNENSNALRKHLRLRNVSPESCKSISFIAYGPILPYVHSQPRHPDFDVSRKRVGALERKLWTEAKAQNTMLNGEPSFDAEFDEALWQGVRDAFTPHLNLRN